MNELEKRLHYPLGDTLPEGARTLEVAPGVKWLRMALPFALNHINLWLLRDEQDGPQGRIKGWSVVDCCIDRAESRAQWEQVFEKELEGLPILRVIVTHMHPDHIGLAHWLCERWNAPMWISATDFNAARIASQSTTGFGGEAAARFFASHGLTDPDALAKVRARTGYYPSMVPRVPERYHRMMDGQAIAIGSRTWRCISGYGHAPEHMALHCDELKVLISGDMMLPRISTNVSVSDLEPEADPLALYLASIEAMRALPPDTLVLPSHGRPFVGLHTRIAQLLAHHDDRLEAALAACRLKPHSAAELLPVLFHRVLDLHQTTFAMGEAIAHLHLLQARGQVRPETGLDGVCRFSGA